MRQPIRHSFLFLASFSRLLSAALLLLLLAACTAPPEHFTITHLNGYTPVKYQGRSQTCWAYAMLAAIETEHIGRGDSVHLSVAWVERMIERDTLAPQSKRGMGMTLINIIGRDGLVPFDAMPDTTYAPPHFAFMLGAQYTPQEFARSVCAPGEYIGIGCDDSQPYGSLFTPDSPDNWEHNRLLNMHPDSLLLVVEHAVSNGHGVCWEGDISERGFDWKNGVARLSLINGRTTDDHCMAIVGLARDDNQKPFFIMKNSWGTNNARDGLLFMAYDYFRSKTIAVFLPHTCIFNIKPAAQHK